MIKWPGIFSNASIYGISAWCSIVQCVKQSNSLKHLQSWLKIFRMHGMEYCHAIYLYLYFLYRASTSLYSYTFLYHIHTHTHSHFSDPSRCIKTVHFQTHTFILHISTTTMHIWLGRSEFTINRLLFSTLDGATVEW